MTKPRGRPEAVDRQTLIDTTLRLIDSGGTSAVTMRRIASELGVSPMAAYRHVDSKDELLRIAAAETVRSIVVDPSGSWSGDLVEFFVAFRGRILAHPGVAGLFGGPGFLSEVVYDVAEPIIEVLLEAGFDPDDATSLFLACASTTIGMTVLQSGHDLDNPENLAAPDPQRVPAVATIIDHLRLDLEVRHRESLDALVKGYALLLSDR